MNPSFALTSTSTSPVDAAPRTPDRASVWWATWIAGPDCGATVALATVPGRWLAGRDPSAALQCADPALATHHAVVEMCPAEAATDRAQGKVPRVTILAAPPAMSSPGTMSSPDGIALPGCVELGMSVLALHRSAPPPAVVRPDGMVRRRARPRRPVPVPPQEPVDLTYHPDDSDSRPGIAPAATLISSAVGLVVALAMAVVLRQPMFAWFALSGAVVASTGWVVQHVWQRRSERRQHAAREAHRAEFHAALADHDRALRRHTHALTPTVPRAWHTIVHGDRHLWERRGTDDDALVVSVGARAPAVGHIAADLSVRRRLAITGPHAVGAARGLLLQLVAQCGPADLRLVGVIGEAHHSTDESPPAHLDRLPHGVVCTPEDMTDVLTAEVAATRHVVVVTDLAEQLAIRTSPLRRALDTRPDVSLICLSEGSPPLVCTSEVATDHAGGVTWTPDRALPSERWPGRLTGIGTHRWANAVAALGALTDPEDDAATRDLPEVVDLSDVVDLDPAAVASRWALGASIAPRALIGVAADGLVDIDLVRDGPHALVVGTTGSGKSELLRTLLVTLAASTPPDLLQFVLVDFKGGAAFDACADLPHVVGLVTDLDAGGCERVLRSLRAELRRREGVLRGAGVADVIDLAADHGGLARELPRLVVVIDEFAVLAQELPEVLRALVDIARRGRSLGVHLVLATQRATGTLSDDIRANTALRIALRLHDAGESRDVVGDESAAHLPRRSAGRAVVRLGDDERVMFQSAYSAPSLAAVVATLSDVARESSLRPRRRPWCEPLPDLVTDEERDAIGSDALGLIDDTDGQCRRALQWAPESGGLLLIGGPRTGVTGALLLLADHITRRRPSRAVIRVDATLGEVDLHRALGSAAADPDAVLLVDRLDLVRAALESAGRDLHLEMLLHSLARQCCTVVGTSTLAAVPGTVLARLPTRWATRLSDPFELAGLGLRPEDNPPPTPGRIIIAAGVDTGLAAQLAIGPDEWPGPSSGLTGRPRRTSPDQWEAQGESADGNSLGVDLATGAEVALCTEPGEHLLVTGTRRSGRTTALSALAAAWIARHPGEPVVRITGRATRGSLPGAVEAAADSALRAPTLLLVDDAELIDDDPALHALLVDRHLLLTVAIAVDPAGLRGRYGHWTLEVRRHRTGLALIGGDDDGDAWGVVLPRRLPLSPAPGRALVIRRGVIDESLGPRIIAIHAHEDEEVHPSGGQSGGRENGRTAVTTRPPASTVRATQSRPR